MTGQIRIPLLPRHCEALRHLNAGRLQDNLREALVHRKSRSDVARTCVADSSKVEGRLHLAVLSVFTVQREEDDVRHLAERRHVRAEKRPVRIRHGAGDLIIHRSDLGGRAVRVVHFRERVHQIDALHSKKHIQQDGTVSLRPESLAYSRARDNRDLSLRRYAAAQYNDIHSHILLNLLFSARQTGTSAPLYHNFNSTDHLIANSRQRSGCSEPLPEHSPVRARI